MDLFEPEATCISEERFGQGRNTSRYNAFGDGPKFVCGLDSIPVGADPSSTDHSLLLVWSTRLEVKT
jgi:hypothetical protein